MHSLIFIAALGAIAPVVAEELNAKDVPAACATICEPIVQLTNTCDIDPQEADNDGDDKRKRLRLRAEADEEAVEANCICTNRSFDVANVMALCASCITQNGKASDDMDTMMRQCSFTPAAYSPAATSVVAGIQVDATKPATAVGASPTSGGNAAAPTSPGNNTGERAIVPIAAVIMAAVAGVFAL
ncbi:Protein CAP22 [Paramyrothecium foliicola]|nr:Protein CAP22 [Paramyrothecium foliicola]